MIMKGKGGGSDVYVVVEDNEFGVEKLCHRLESGLGRTNPYLSDLT